MKRIALNAEASVAPRLAAISLSLQAMTEPELEGTAEIVRTVVPPPGEDGELPTRDGRTQRVSDPAALAAALNAQAVDVRIDFDHQSERSSRTFRGSTAAEGWAKNFRATAEGAIEAVLELSSWARHEIRSGRYKYLSPALLSLKDTGEVMGMSSLALVNDPNMLLALHNANPGGDSDDAERERELAEREETATRLMMSAAERSVDAAIEGKRLAPAQKEFVLNSIRSHPDGIEKGIQAFEAAFPAGAAAPTLNNLDRRVGPTGAPGGGGVAPAAKFRGPLGVDVSEEGLTLHSQVAAHARERGISYRQSVMELGALQQ
ncbi:MAG: hypothetical protein OXQ28_00550 [Acidobacteriota bacterium]|nr:hypothetical protein [Acidobacteriota bacterium]